MNQQGIEILGWIGAIVTGLCFLPQAVKVITSKTTKDISLIMIVTIICANVIWIVYGVLIKSPQLWATNTTQLLIMVTITCYKCYNISVKKETLFKHSKKKRK